MKLASVVLTIAGHEVEHFVGEFPDPAILQLPVCLEVTSDSHQQLQEAATGITLSNFDAHLEPG